MDLFDKMGCFMAPVIIRNLTLASNYPSRGCELDCHSWKDAIIRYSKETKTHDPIQIQLITVGILVSSRPDTSMTSAPHWRRLSTCNRPLWPHHSCHHRFRVQNNKISGDTGHVQQERGVM